MQVFRENSKYRTKMFNKHEMKLAIRFVDVSITQKLKGVRKKSMQKEKYSD